MIKIKTPIRWFEGERSGLVILIADDGAVILSDHSREVMPEWLDEIVRAVNAHDALVDACSTALTAMVQMGNDLNWPATIPQSYADAITALRAARAMAKGDADG